MYFQNNIRYVFIWYHPSRVVSMGGCSLVLSMVLYLSESLYFRSSSLTFYVIFPCVLNSKFIFLANGLSSRFNTIFSCSFTTQQSHWLALFTSRSGCDSGTRSSTWKMRTRSCSNRLADISDGATRKYRRLMWITSFLARCES